MKYSNIVAYTIAIFLSLYFLFTLKYFFTIKTSEISDTFFLEILLCLLTLGFGSWSHIKFKKAGKVIFTVSVSLMFVLWPNSFIKAYVYDLSIWGNILTVPLGILSIVLIWIGNKDQSIRGYGSLPYLSFILMTLAIAGLTWIKMNLCR